MDENETDSIQHCHNSIYKYKVFYHVGQQYDFPNMDLTNDFDAVSSLHIKFWNYIRLFCQSDSSQIEKFINMNSISLLLRFYDRKRYNEMCCKEHLDVFKDEYMKNKKIMNPPLNKKLSYMKDVLDVIIYCQEPKNSFYLFKLMTLDLSPCLIKFIINIFTKAFESHASDQEWKVEIINQLL